MADTECRVERYHGLLAESGIAPAALQQSAARAQSDSTLNEGPTLAGCLTNPERLREGVRTRAGRDADHRRLRAQASVLQQDMALNIIAPLVMELFITGKAALPDPQRMRLRASSHGSTVGNWQWLGGGDTVGVDQFAAEIAIRVNAWFSLFRQHLGVAPGAYWSSIGLALCAPFSALYDKAPPEKLCAEASDWLNAIDCDARRYIDWIPASLGNYACAIPQRRGCCLKFLLPEGGYCGTCGIYRSERMALSAATRQQTRPSLWSPGQQSKC